MVLPEVAYGITAQDSAVSKRRVDYEDHAVCLPRAKDLGKFASVHTAEVE